MSGGVDTVKCISIVDGYEGNGNLWFAVSDPTTPQRLFDYIMNNREEDEEIKIIVEEVPKEDFERED